MKNYILCIHVADRPVKERMNKTQKDIPAAAENMRSRLMSFIRKRVPSVEDAEDILQDVFYQLALMDSMSKPVEHTSAWLFRVARNLIINWRKKKREDSYPEYYDNYGRFQDIRDILLCDDSTPETVYLRSLVWREIEDALNELPAEQREIFKQTEFFGMRIKEISEESGVPVNTLLSRKHYAVLKLRKRLKYLYDSFTDAP